MSCGVFVVQMVMWSPETPGGDVKVGEQPPDLLVEDELTTTTQLCLPSCRPRYTWVEAISVGDQTISLGISIGLTHYWTVSDMINHYRLSMINHDHKPKIASSISGNFGDHKLHHFASLAWCHGRHWGPVSTMMASSARGRQRRW